MPYFSKPIDTVNRYSASIKYVNGIPVSVNFSDDDFSSALSKKNYSRELGEAIGKLTTLKKISISTKQLTDQDVTNMLNDGLEELYIGSGCISDATLFELAKTTKKLKILCISHSHVTNVGLSYVVPMPSIERIAICSQELCVGYDNHKLNYNKFFPNVDISVALFTLGKTCHLCNDEFVSAHEFSSDQLPNSDPDSGKVPL